MNLLEPWVLLRLAAGLLAAALFVRGAVTAWRVLRHFDVARATEGQLLLERHAELAATFVRVATVVQVGALALSVLAADRLHDGVRGAMCAYGVFNANEWGFSSLAASMAVALLAGVLGQVQALDARLRTLSLVRVVALLTLVLAPLSLIDLVFAGQFFLGLDLTVVASCCSVQLDAEGAGRVVYATGPRLGATVAALVAIGASVLVGLAAVRRPTRARAIAVGVASFLSLPLALAAVVLEVAPHAFEAPQHMCPFCLLRGDVLGLGYPLFGAIGLATVWGIGTAVAALLRARATAQEGGMALDAFVRSRARREVAAWCVALVLGAAPVARYLLVAGGAPLFP